MIYRPWGGQFWPMEPNNHIILYFRKEEYYSIMKTLYEKKNARTYFLTLLGAMWVWHLHYHAHLRKKCTHIFSHPSWCHLSMTFTLSCTSNKSSYFSQITVYAKHIILYFRKEEYYSIMNTLWENNANTYFLTLLGAIWVWHLHYHAHLTSHHISHKSPYMLSIILH